MASLKRNRRFSTRIYLVLGLCLMAAGCATPPERRHPDYQAYLPHVRTVLCIAPEFGVFTASDAGLVRQDKQSQAAGEQITTAVARDLIEKGFKVVRADAQTLHQPDVLSLRALFRAVNHSIQLHTYGPQIYPHKQAIFDYSLGSVADLLHAHGADALVLINGQQTASRAGANTWLSAAMVAPQGQILWYSAYGDKAALELSDAYHAGDVVAKALAGLRGGV